MIYLGADHGGFKLKEEIKKWLKEWHFDFSDMGAKEFVDQDDYPDYAWPVAMKVGNDHKSKGILVCRSGQGVCIVANKARHARAALVWNEQTAFSARNDDDANILCLPSDYITVEGAKPVIHAFLTTPFNKDPKYNRRIEKVKKIDHNL
jgi:ribose 5-phosphate isomerase B